MWKWSKISIGVIYKIQIEKKWWRATDIYPLERTQKSFICGWYRAENSWGWFKTGNGRGGFINLGYWYSHVLLHLFIYLLYFFKPTSFSKVNFSSLRNCEWCSFYSRLIWIITWSKTCVLFYFSHLFWYTLI